MKTTTDNHPLPPTDFFALPLQTRRRKKARQHTLNLLPMFRQSARQSFNHLTEIKIPP